MRRAMWILGAAAATLAATAQDDEPAIDPATLYFFFSPDTPRLDELAKALRRSGVPVRPVLLLTGFNDWPEPFLSALADLGELRVIDEEGLALARLYRVARTPCFVYRGHVAHGARTDLKEVLTCSR
ncbi:MAG: hypothetical protein HYY16_15230 [Planctomycetes bacterium]|nr:hypothetical protein [Planctomycetota bacterium]